MLCMNDDATRRLWGIMCVIINIHNIHVQYVWHACTKCPSSMHNNILCPAYIHSSYVYLQSLDGGNLDYTLIQVLWFA